MELLIRLPGTAMRMRKATKNEVLEAAASYICASMTGKPVLDTPQATRMLLNQMLAAHDHEVFGILMLDNRHRCIGTKILFRGTIDGASVYPREVVKESLHCNAAAVILFHNHPSGIAEPSQADELITRRLCEALALVDIRVLDHLIVAGSSCVSFAEKGLL